MRKALDMILRAGMMSDEERKQDYQSRMVARLCDTEAENGIGVSTAWVVDGECFETALLTETQTEPVERYTTKEAAIEGHAKWIEFAKTAEGKTVVSLGLPEVPGTDTKVIIRSGR